MIISPNFCENYDVGRTKDVSWPLGRRDFELCAELVNHTVATALSSLFAREYKGYRGDYRSFR